MARILIADDDSDVRAMLRITLEREGFEVDEAGNGREALQRYRATPADVVLLDLIMPEMEGMETIRVLSSENPGVRIIAMSGGGRFGPETYLSLAGKCGAARCFTKPIDREELLQAIRQLVA